MQRIKDATVELEVYIQPATTYYLAMQKWSSDIYGQYMASDQSAQSDLRAALSTIL